MGYNNHTIATNTELTFDPPKLSKWQRFLQSSIFKTFAFTLVIATFLVCAITGNLLTFVIALGMTGLTLGIGGAISGFQSKNQGKGFWDGFANYITANWAVSVAISMAIVLVAVGVSAIIQAVGNAGVANGVTEPNYAEYARQATHNPDSPNVVLGKYDRGGSTSYIEVAKANNATYFSMSNWDEVAKLVGEQNMWKINEAFLNQQIALGKVFYSSHSMAMISGAFLDEIMYLAKLNIMILPL